MKSWASQLTTEHWFALQVWTGREQLAAAHLQLRGYEIFLPSYCVQRRWSDRVKRVPRALFAGYLFCRLRPETFGKMITTPGVIRIVGNTDGPMSVPLHEIEALQRVVETRLLVEPWPFLKVGQRVTIAEGPLRGTEGLILRVKNQHRLVISLSLLQRSVAVDVPSDWIAVPPAARLAHERTA
jgi:transcription antitermination factor NusG